MAMIALGVGLREKDHSVNAKRLVLLDDPSIELTYRSDGEFELTGVSLDVINASLVTLITSGVQVSAVYPVHSALEQQFREAVGGRRVTDR